MKKKLNRIHMDYELAEANAFHTFKLLSVYFVLTRLYGETQARKGHYSRRQST